MDNENTYQIDIGDLIAVVGIIGLVFCLVIRAMFGG
jgi:hypothetical protein